MAKLEPQKVNAKRINQLLGMKEENDASIKRSLLAKQFFVDGIETTQQSKQFNKRIVAIIHKMRAFKFDRLLKRIEKQKKINEELITLAPHLYSKTDPDFKEVKVIKDVLKILVSINATSNSQKKTGKQLAARAIKLSKIIRSQINELPDYLDTTSLEQQYQTYLNEAKRFNKEPERVFRLKGHPKKDIVLFYFRTGDTKLQKLHVSAGGVLVIRHELSDEKNFKIQDKFNTGRASIFDTASPIPNELDLNGVLYDEEEIERIREHTKKEKSQADHKIRPENDEYVN